jgi:hypothetical protein
MQRSPLTAILAAFLTTAAEAADMQITRLADQTVVRKKTTTELAFDLPDLPAGRQVRLALSARVNYSCSCANNPAMTAAVNSQSIVGANLLNKPLEYRNKNGRDASWATPRGSTWLLFSWPDFSTEAVRAFESPYAIPEADPFRFVWDITALARPGRNTLCFTHLEITGEEHYLELREVQVEVGDPVASKALVPVAPAPTGEVPDFVPRGRHEEAMALAVGAAGAIRLEVGTRRLDILTRTSVPAGGWVETPAGGWSAVPRGGIRRVTWPCTGYTTSRTVELCADYVQVRDTFANTTAALVGVMVEHRLVLPEPPVEVRLGGRPPYSRFQNEGGGTNPTAIARWPDLAVGLVADDDIFRVHAKGFATGRAVGLADHELGLGPGQAHTLEWSIYPVAHGGYWDIINAIRRTWGANFTIPAQHPFVAWPAETDTDEYYRDWVARRGVRWVSSYDAMFNEGKAAMGTAIPLATDFCQRTAGWMARLHRVAPEVKALFYMNCTLCTEPGAAEKYADSRLLDATGTQLTMAAGSPQGVTMAPLFVATPGNCYGKAMMAVAERLVTEFGADGLYHDVFNSGGYGVRAFHGPWDGCTVVIDPETHAVTGQCSSLPLLQQSWHAALVSFLRARGKLITANGPVETRTMLRLQVPVFTETGFSFASVIDTHLGSPWAYGNYPARDPARGVEYNAAYTLRRILEYGGILALPNWPDAPQGTSFLQLLYPITPIEIRAGMVIAEERIVTSVSGRYGWGDSSSAQAHVFNGGGQRVDSPQVSTVRQDGRVLTEVRMPGDHFAILVRGRPAPP